MLMFFTLHDAKPALLPASGKQPEGLTMWPEERTLMLMSLKAGSRPPCTMPNRFCCVGRPWAWMQRSSQRVVRWVASSKLPGRQVSQQG